MRRSVGIALLSVWLVAAVSGCQSTRNSQVPDWWDNPHQHDDQNLYFTAEGISSRSYEDARQQARGVLRTKLAEYIFADTEYSAVNGDSKTEVALRELDASYGDEEGRIGGRYHVWLMGRYPRAQYEVIRMRLDKARELSRAWEQAQSAINREQYGEAEKLLLATIGQYDTALQVPFDLEEVKLALAGSYLKQERNLKARHWIVDVQSGTQDPAWRFRANNMLAQLPPFSLKDAFEGQRVGLYACVRTEGEISIDQELVSLLETRMAMSAIQTHVCSNQIAALRFDEGSLKQISTVLAAQNVDAAFVLVLDIDASKSGAQVDIPETNGLAYAPDAKLTYFVIRTSDGRILASDSTLGLSGAKRGMVNTILTHRRHLPTHAQTIADGLTVSSQ